jgi:hypothetical protein
MSNQVKFDKIVRAQRAYVANHFGIRVLHRSEFGVGSDDECTYVESVIRCAGAKREVAGKYAYDRMLATFVVDAEGKTSNVHVKGRPNSLKHVVSVLG